MQLSIARDNMIKQQLRTFGVVNPQILSLVAAIPREQFMPEHLIDLAYADVAISLGRGQALMTPKETAKMLQALEIKGNEKVLLVGAGNGYVAALLSKLAKQIDVVDGDQELLQQAQEKISQLGINNVIFHSGSASTGWEKGAPYNVIIITGSLLQLPQGFKKNLARGGRIFAIIGNSPVMEATIFKRATQQWTTEKIFETNHPRLPNVGESKTFIF